MIVRKTPFWTCRYCKKNVRLRKDGRAARHEGVNRHLEPGWRCIGSLYAVTQAAKIREQER
jgi:hypothetical protein